LNRRAFLRSTAAATLTAVANAAQQTPEFRTSNAQWQTAYDNALAVLAANVRQPRGISPSAAPPASQTSILGPNTAIALQAMAVGKSLVGMRADDVIRSVNWLVSLPDVDRSAIAVYGRAAEGMAVLHAAAIDERISHVVVENTLFSYRLALDAPLHRSLSDIIVPGVLLHYDVGDLLRAISPRTVTMVNPADAIGGASRGNALHTGLASVRVVRRGFRDPLPID
jgi:hypothetical protein